MKKDNLLSKMLLTASFFLIIVLSLFFGACSNKPTEDKQLAPVNDTLINDGYVDVSQYVDSPRFSISKIFQAIVFSGLVKEGATNIQGATVKIYDRNGDQITTGAATATSAADGTYNIAATVSYPFTVVVDKGAAYRLDVIVFYASPQSPVASQLETNPGGSQTKHSLNVGLVNSNNQPLKGCLVRYSTDIFGNSKYDYTDQTNGIAEFSSLNSLARSCNLYINGNTIPFTAFSISEFSGKSANIKTTLIYP